MKLRAPYNFVPLSSDGVFYPDWAESISLDKPFKDGMTGVIDVTFKAESPIFVRNGLSKMLVTEDIRRSICPNDYNRFNHIVDGNGNMRYFIPGSSVKGLLRSTVEIISNGKFAQVENQSFGKRDLHSKEYTQNMRDVRCGWLKKEGDVYALYDHGTPVSVEAKELDNLFPHLKLFDFITQGNFRSDSQKTAKIKYGRFFNGRISRDTFVEEMCKICRSKGMGGVLVFTGQQGRHKPDEGRFKKGKHHEFLIPDIRNPKRYEVDRSVIEAFTSIYANSEDWNSLWFHRFDNGLMIPVFFIVTDGKVRSMGLSRMYRYPYAKSVWDAVDADFRKAEPDLAECMFGYVGKDNSDALKGRVHVGHFFVAENETPESADAHKLILGTPHPSYYPLYVQGGSTWDESVEVNGRKFYPIHKDGPVPLLQDKDNPAISEDGKLVESVVAMCPLAKGTEFSGKVRFFNLRPFELGALVAALTLFNDKDRYHSIGMGKPLGYGKTSATVESVSVYRNAEPENNVVLTVDECIGFFTQGTNGYDYTKWAGSEVNREFTAMTKENDDIDSYMVMTTDARTDEFRTLKKSKGLPRFTMRTKGTEAKILKPGRYSGEIVSSQSVTDRVTRKNTWKYGVSLDSNPDIILTAEKVPVQFNVGSHVSVNVVKDYQSGLFYIKGVFNL